MRSSRCEAHRFVVVRDMSGHLIEGQPERLALAGGTRRHLKQRCLWMSSQACDSVVGLDFGREERFAAFQSDRLEFRRANNACERSPLNSVRDAFSPAAQVLFGVGILKDQRFEARVQRSQPGEQQTGLGAIQDSDAIARRKSMTKRLDVARQRRAACREIQNLVGSVANERDGRQARSSQCAVQL